MIRIGLAFSVVLCLQAPWFAAGQANSPKAFNKEGTGNQVLTYATCALDIGQGAAVLGQAGLYINQAKMTCSKPWNKDATLKVNLQRWTDDDSALCSTSVNQVLYSMSFAAAFISSAASNCAKTVNLGAYCAADVANLIGDLTTIAGAGSHMKLTCARDAYSKQNPPPTPKQLKANYLRAEYINSKTRRLDEANDHEALTNQFATSALRSSKDFLTNLHQQSADHGDAHDLAKLPGPEVYEKFRALVGEAKLNKMFKPKDAKAVEAQNKDIESRQNTQAQCAFNIAVVSTMIVRAAVALVGSAGACGVEAVAAGPGKMLCAVDISGAISALSYAAGSLALAMAQCPVGKTLDYTLDASCAFDISAVVGAVSGIVTSGASYDLSCGRKGEQLEQRRLSNETMEVLPAAANSPLHI